jgi:hypothetical protein
LIAHGARRIGCPPGFRCAAGSFRVRTIFTTARDHGVEAHRTYALVVLLASEKHGSWMKFPMKQRHASLRP